jgi:riboflavin synthase
MFTGLVQAVGRVEEFTGHRLRILAPAGWPPPEDPLTAGESVAVNGVCLTCIAEETLAFDLSDETLRRTSLGHLTRGQAVNLERAMRPIDRFGGHLVQGHVDATGTVIHVDSQPEQTVLRVQVPPTGRRYLVDKGSIAIDGISLTVVEPSDDEFSAWIIPHTLAHTNLGERRAGDTVNLEYDAVAKWIERLVGAYR